MSTPLTRGALKRAIGNAELTASLLRQPGFHRLGQTERDRIADLLDTLAGASKRLLGPPPTPLPDIAAFDQTAESEATEADLFGGAA